MFLNIHHKKDAVILLLIICVNQFANIYAHVESMTSFRTQYRPHVVLLHHCSTVREKIIKNGFMVINSRCEFA